MKRIVQLTVILLAFLPAISFAQEKKTTWPELKKFHSFMAATFHPAEEGKFAPLKQKADSLFEAARTWQRSAIPEDFKAEETKEALKKLVIKCAAVKKAVEAKSSDEVLKKLITEAHEIFHQIVEKCHGPDTEK